MAKISKKGHPNVHMLLEFQAICVLFVHTCVEDKSYLEICLERCSCKIYKKQTNIYTCT